VATGTGRISVSMAQKGAHVVAVDQALHMLKRAGEKAHRNNVKHIAFLGANARQLPFNDNTFDVVTSVRFLTIIPPEYLFLYVDEMKRVLKKGGLLVIEFNNKLNIRELIKVKNRRKDPWPWQINNILQGLKVIEKKGFWFPGQRRIAKHNRGLTLMLSKLGSFFPFYHITSQVVVKATK